MKKKLFAILIIAVLACTFIVPTYAVPTQAATAKTGIYKVHNQNRYYKKGKFKKVTGLVKDVRHKKWVYVKKGIFKKVTGVVPKYGSKKEYYVKNGVLNKATGLAKNLTTGKLVYVEKGVVNKSYIGCAKNLTDNKYYFVKKGTLPKWTGYSTDSKGHIMHVVKGAATRHKHKWEPHKYVHHYEERNNTSIKIWVCYCGERFRSFEEYDEHVTAANHGGCYFEYEANPNWESVPVYANTPGVFICSECKADISLPPTYKDTSMYFKDAGSGAIWTYCPTGDFVSGAGAARNGVTQSDIKNGTQIKNNNW